MMGRQDRDQGQLFYEFSLDDMIATDHLLRRINVFATAVLADLQHQLKAFYSEIGRPSVDPELMIRMLLVGYCYGIRHETPAASGSGVAPCLPLVLQARSRRQGSAPFDSR
jgi:transposase